MATSSWPAPSSAARMAADLPVHHPARRDHVGARLGLRQRDALVELERGVVQHLAVGAEHAAVPVVGVLVEAEVGHEDELVAHRVAHGAQRDLHDAVGVPGAAALRVLVRRARRRGSARGRRGTPAAWPRRRASPACAAPRRAWTRSAPARRCPRGRRAGPPGRPTEAGLGDQAPQRRRAPQPAQPAYGKAARSGRRRRLGHADQPTGPRVRLGFPTSPDQLVDDALRPRRPTPRARRQAGRPAAAAVVGPMHTTWAGTAHASPAAVRSARNACTDDVAVNVSASAAATRSSRAGLGRGRAARCDRPPRVGRPNPSHASPSGMVSGARSAHGNRTRRGVIAARGAGNSSTRPRRAVLGRHQVGFDAGRRAARPPWPAHRGHEHAEPSARASRKCAHEAVHRVDRRQHDPVVRADIGSRRPATPHRRRTGRPGASGAAPTSWRRPARARRPGRGAGARTG